MSKASGRTSCTRSPTLQSRVRRDPTLESRATFSCRPPKKRPTARQRRAVVARAHGRCEYCLSPERVSVSPFSVEHIRPRARGGKTTLENLALSCQGCNNFKYIKTSGIDPKTGKRAPLQ